MGPGAPGTPAAIVLAAGRGKRFPGVPSKVLVRLAGRTLVEHVLDAASRVPVGRVVVVVGHGREAVRAQLAGRKVEFAEQDEPRGTGHAALCAGPALAAHAGPVLVLNGDVPLLAAESLSALLHAVGAGGAAGALLTARLEQPGAYGRVVRGPSGAVAAIVEAADADPATLAIGEINVGAYAFHAPELFTLLGALEPDNAQREIYLTDVVRVLVARGDTVTAVPVRRPIEASGVNTPAELEELERALSSSAAPRGGALAPDTAP